MPHFLCILVSIYDGTDTLMQIHALLEEVYIYNVFSACVLFVRCKRCKVKWRETLDKCRLHGVYMHF